MSASALPHAPLPLTDPMATRSAIGYLRSDGSIRAVYCHWDGYPEHQLPILTEHYNNLRKVQALIRPGSMSSLRTEQLWDSSYDSESGAYHPSRQAQPLYHHERGNGPWNANGAIPYCQPPRTCADLNEAKDYWPDSGCEHLYVFSLEDGWLHYFL